MPKRKRDVAAPIGRPKRARQPRKESEFVHESATPMPVMPIVGEQAAEQHSAIAGPGHSMQVPTLTEDQMDRNSAQLNRPRTAAANETVTSGSFQELTGESTFSPSTVDTTNSTIFGLPVDHHMSEKTRSKVWANEYVDFRDLLLGEANGLFTLAVHNFNNAPTLSVERRENKQFLTYAQWSLTFEVFVAIYSKRCPLETPQLMKYASLVRLLHNSGQAWYHYDQCFRQYRALKPVPWNLIHSEIWCTATLPRIKQTGPNTLRNKPSTPPFRERPAAASTTQPKGFCWSYNTTGTCAAGWPRDQTCRHRHVCCYCRASHPECSCPRKPNGAKSKQDFQYQRFR